LPLCLRRGVGSLAQGLGSRLGLNLEVLRLGLGLGLSHSLALAFLLEAKHGHIDVNGHRVDIPSFQVKPNDVIEVREKSKNNPTILAARDATAHAPAPNWIDVDREGLTGRVTSLPLRSELVQIQLNEQLIVELYSK